MKQKKSDLTRRRIIAAAREIFSQYPYDTAGVRRIEQAGGFNYALIRYYFGSKKGLFDTVADELVTEYINGIFPLLGILGQKPLEEALPRLIDKMFDFCFDHPDGMAIIMLNIGHSKHFDDTMLGLDAIKKYVTEIQRQAAGLAPAEVSEKHRSMIVMVLILITVNAVGATAFHAQAVDLKPDSRQYRQWVKDAVQFLFLPLVNSDSDAMDVPVGVIAGNGVSPATNTAAFSGTTPHPGVESPDLSEETPGRQTKGDVTRQRILDAAQAVFTRHPYHSASIRMIGKEGGFDFTIIHHYFATKEDLAQAVINRFYEEFFRESDNWLALLGDLDISGLTLRQGFNIYMEHLLDFYFQTPDAPAILMQNIARMDSPALAPIYQYSRRFYTDIFTRLKAILPSLVPEEKIRMWQFCLVMLIINFVGAAPYLARTLDMKPDDSRYRDWVKEILAYIFFPGLVELLQG